MTKNTLSRRKFIKGTVGAGIALSAIPMLGAFEHYDSKGLPTAILGSTGVRIPRIALGLGSRFCEIDDEDISTSLLSHALDNGLYYWDTANIYENKRNGAISEERLGKVVKHRRKEIFLSTKVSNRDPEQAMREIELSLTRLNTDKLDMLKIHSIQSMEDVDQICGKGQLGELLHKLKEQGLTRFIGFSGHSNAEAMQTLAERGNFDSMLIAMNHWRMNEAQKRQELAIPAALQKGMGVMLMKAVRPKEKIENIKAEDLIRFALSLQGPNGLVLGVDSMEVLQSNLEILRDFTPMDAGEKQKMSQSLSPFFNHESLEWMDPSYRDGNWA